MLLPKQNKDDYTFNRTNSAVPHVQTLDTNVVKRVKKTKCELRGCVRDFQARSGTKNETFGQNYNILH